MSLYRTRVFVTSAAVVALALISGFFYAYACSVMVGLARTDDRTFIASMQWINATVRNWAFAPSFFGALLLGAAAVALNAAGAPRRWRDPVTLLSAGALAIYAVAAFGVTMVLNVPLNDQLAAAGDPAQIPDPAAVRAAYEGPWTRWNIVRTATSTVALGFALAALYRMGDRRRPSP